MILAREPLRLRGEVGEVVAVFHRALDAAGAGEAHLVPRTRDVVLMHRVEIVLLDLERCPAADLATPSASVVALALDVHRPAGLVAAGSELLHSHIFQSEGLLVPCAKIAGSPTVSWWESVVRAIVTSVPDQSIGAPFKTERVVAQAR